MSAAHKFQINLDLQPVERHPALKNLAKALVPVLWVDITMDASDELIEFMKKPLR